MGKQSIYFKTEEDVINYYGSLDNIPSKHLVIVENSGAMYANSNNAPGSDGQTQESGGEPISQVDRDLVKYTLEGVPLTKVEFDARTLYNTKIAFNEMTLNNSDCYETSCAGGTKAIAIDETFENGDKKYYWFGGDTIMNAYNTPYQGVETEYQPMSGGSIYYMTTCTLNGKFLWDSSNKTLTITYA